MHTFDLGEYALGLALLFEILRGLRIVAMPVQELQVRVNGLASEPPRDDVVDFHAVSRKEVEPAPQAFSVLFLE